MNEMRPLPVTGLGSVGLDLSRISNFIKKLQQEREWRPTVVVILENPAGKIGVGRQKNGEDNWGTVQGEINKNETLIEAGMRESGEELGLPPEVLEVAFPLLHTGQSLFSRGQPTNGYTRGKWYFCVGMRLIRDVPLTLVPPDGEIQAIYDWRWVDYGEACRLCIKQPFVRNLMEETRRKGWVILAPAIRELETLRSR